jgi:hypothetical protein
MTTINLGAASWLLAKAKLRLELAASASLNAQDLLLKDKDLLTKDVWIYKGHNFHFSLNISCDSCYLESGVLNGDTVAHFIASALTQAPVGRVTSNLVSANDEVPVLVAVRSCGIVICTAFCRRQLPGC